MRNTASTYIDNRDLPEIVKYQEARIQFLEAEVKRLRKLQTESSNGEKD